MSSFKQNDTNGSSTSACDAPVMVVNQVMTAYLVVILLLTLAGNVLVIAVVIVYPRLRQVANYFIVSLAVADLLYAVFFLPLAIHQTYHNGVWCLNVETCAFWLVVDAICSCASICNLAAISYDRYSAITKPFHYIEYMSNFRALAMITTVWLYSLFWGSMALFNFEESHKSPISITRGTQADSCHRNEPYYYTLAACFAFFGPLICVVTTYSIILKAAITQAKAVAALDPTRDRRRRTNFFREVKATKTIALVIGAFVISWLPVFTILLISLWDMENTLAFEREHPRAHKVIFFTFLRVLPPLNSCINPIIYAVFNSNFRSAFMKFLHIRRRPEHNLDHDMTQRTSYTSMSPEKSDAVDNTTT